MAKFFWRLVTLLLIPSFILNSVDIPKVIIPYTPQEAELMQLPEGYVFSYDDVLDLLDELEEGDLEERCSYEELERISVFIALLARQGLISNEASEQFALEYDIKELLTPPIPSYLSLSIHYLYQGGRNATRPLGYYSQDDVLLCKSWASKRWHHTKNFVKKHKKAIIIGVAVVVAATVVVCAAAAITSAAASAGAASLSEKDKKPSDHKKEETASQDPQPEIQPENAEIFTAAQESPVLKATLDKQIIAFKETVVEKELLQTEHASTPQDPVFVETVRNVVSGFAHEALDGMAEVAAVVPMLFSELADIRDKLLPSALAESLSVMSSNGSPVENYEKKIAKGHDAIDNVFSTNLAGRYDPECKREGEKIRDDLGIQVKTGIIPSPSSLVSGVFGKTGRIAATQASKVRGWSVGQPIHNRTIFGAVPKWNLVRQRYWKNRAAWAKSNPHNYGNQNIPRMEKGLAPQRFNQETRQMESKELHHIPPRREGGLFDFVELWPEEHAAVDPHRCLGK